MEGRQERVEPLDRAYDLSSFSGEVEAVARDGLLRAGCGPVCQTTSSADTSARASMSPVVKAAYAPEHLDMG
jgi:hypothetical protein